MVEKEKVLNFSQLGWTDSAKEKSSEINSSFSFRDITTNFH